MRSEISKSNLATSYIKFYETISKDTLDDVFNLVDTNIHFKDPFNDIRGIENYRSLLFSMLQNVPDIRFKILNVAFDDKACFFRWESKATLKFLTREPWIIQGMSQISFSDDDLVKEHIDFWDSGVDFYQYLPIIGRIMKIIQRRVSEN